MRITVYRDGRGLTIGAVANGVFFIAIPGKQDKCIRMEHTETVDLSGEDHEKNVFAIMGANWKLQSYASPIWYRAFSADSMAWSFAARKQGRNQNSWIEAKNFEEAIYAAHGEACPIP